MSDFESLRNAHDLDLVPDALLVCPPTMFDQAFDIASVLEAAGILCAPVPSATVVAPQVRIHGYTFPYPEALSSLVLFARFGTEPPKPQ